MRLNELAKRLNNDSSPFERHYANAFTNETLYSIEIHTEDINKTLCMETEVPYGRLLYNSYQDLNSECRGLLVVLGT